MLWVLFSLDLLRSKEWIEIRFSLKIVVPVLARLCSQSSSFLQDKLSKGEGFFFLGNIKCYIGHFMVLYTYTVSIYMHYRRCIEAKMGWWRNFFCDGNNQKSLYDVRVRAAPCSGSGSGSVRLPWPQCVGRYETLRYTKNWNKRAGKEREKEKMK